MWFEYRLIEKTLFYELYESDCSKRLFKLFRCIEFASELSEPKKKNFLAYKLYKEDLS